jgi:hypothetical protein
MIVTIWQFIFHFNRSCPHYRRLLRGRRCSQTCDRKSIQNKVSNAPKKKRKFFCSSRVHVPQLFGLFFLLRLVLVNQTLLKQLKVLKSTDGSTNHCDDKTMKDAFLRPSSLLFIKSIIHRKSPVIRHFRSRYASGDESRHPSATNVILDKR